MKYISKRAIRTKGRQEKYVKIYHDFILKNLDWNTLAKKYGYKNAKSIKTTYYLYIVPFIKENDSSNT